MFPSICLLCNHANHRVNHFLSRSWGDVNLELKLDKNKTYAVALEGGGAKGAYQIGVWKALDEAGIQYNAVSGTSVGSLNGAMMAMRDLPRALAFWQNIRFSQIMNVDDATMKKVFSGDLKQLDLPTLMRNAVETVRQGGFDVDPLKNLLREAISEDAIRASDVAFYLMTYSVTDRKELDIDAKTLAPGELYDMLLASAYFPAFKHEKLGGKLYTDGGVQDVVPVHALTSRGYRDLIVIRIFGVGVERRFRMPKNVNVFTIKPNQDLGNVLNFSSEQSQYDIQLGYYDGKRALYGLYGKVYYIDRTLDEQSAYNRLCDMLRYAQNDLTMRALNEQALPKLAKRVGASDGDYYDILIALLELAAQELNLNPFAIFTDEALFAAVSQRAADMRNPSKSKTLRYFPVHPPV